MALIAYDGFDNYNTSADMQQRFGSLQWYAASDMNINSGGRAGYGKYLSGDSFNAGFATQYQQITVGMGINFYGRNGGYATVQFGDSITGDIHATWTINPSNGLVQFSDAGGVVRASGLNCIAPNGWFFIEMQVKCDATAGTAALRINGQSVPSFPDLTGLNTKNGSNLISAIYWGAQQYTNPSPWYDDIYFADGTTGPGSYPANSFLGDVRCATLFPVSNSSVSWVPLANTNWQEVSETAMDSDVSYNRTATAGAQDTFNYGALDVDVNQVIGLQVTVAVRKEDAGARTVAPVLTLGGTNYIGTAVSVDVSYLYITTIWPINPYTSASWTASDINSLIAGYVVVT